MGRRRGSIPILVTLSVVSVALVWIGGAVTYNNTVTHQIMKDRWRESAEQAARSGTDLILGWGETSIDTNTQLPRDWDMDRDGDVTDPVAGFMNSQFATLGAVREKAGQVTQAGEVLGRKVGEYVVARNGNYLTTFKARLQQVRVSEDLPRQYRLGVVGRIRKIDPTNDVAIDTNERANIVAERMIVSTFGKEPFSKYAVFNDVDLINNWTPGEVIDGPVHINRGYPDESVADRRANMQWTNSTFLGTRSHFIVNTVPGGPFGAVVGKPPHPVFKDLVTLSDINDGNIGNTFSDDEPTNHSTTIGLNGERLNYNAIDAATAQKIFLAPENQAQAAFGGKAGPVLLPKPLDLPRTIRTRLSSSLGVPPGSKIQNYPWFNKLEDGIYIPTKRAWETTVGLAGGFDDPTTTQVGENVPANFRYNAVPDDYPAGGIYIRGNVEIMRMTVKDQYSYYFFQLGYGAFEPYYKDDGRYPDGAVYLGPGVIPASVHRCYCIRVNRVTRETHMRAFPHGSMDLIYDGDTSMDDVNKLNAFFDTPVKKKRKKKGSPDLGGDALPLSTDPGDFVVTVDKDALAKLPPVPASYNDFPFNGVIFVDLSLHDWARDNTDAESRVAKKTPLTGNIWALGDPAKFDDDPKNKRKFGDHQEELVATNIGADPGANTKASRLTIMAAGNIFLQNHVMLETLRRMGQEWNPSQDTFQLSHSRDALGLVADKQIVVGVNAPSEPAGQKSGIVVHAAVAALGDPAYDYVQEMVPDKTLWGAVRRGSFAVAEIMQIWKPWYAGCEEKYYMIRWHSVWPSGFNKFLPGVTDPLTKPTAWQSTSNTSDHFIDYRWRKNLWALGVSLDDDDDDDDERIFIPKHGVYYVPPPDSNGYPNNPLTLLYRKVDTWAENPNLTTGGRGKILNFGSLTVKKRGIVGNSTGIGYQKDYRYDRRLQSIAPPLYPTSSNIVMRAIAPFSPDRLPYEGASGSVAPELTFMGEDAPY